ncbi:MAG: N-acetylmuramoyl-L-alanine amidase family protein [Lachnospiraceae bacterium]|nr:N-acetylmuramoyl-L-alanine amidase family protein [Lachnospiraceae bacterium]
MKRGCKIKRKVIAWMFTFVMVLIMTPSTAFANAGNGTEQHTHGTEWNTDNALPTAEGNYYLTTDITLSSTWEVTTGTVNLCLNGHVIKANGNIRLISISSGATLNIYECQTTEHKFISSKEGAWKLDETLGDRTIQGGVLTGGNFEHGSAILNDGTLNLYGGNIVGNTSTSSDHAYGGAIYNRENATATIYNAADVIGNYGNAHGAAVFNNGIFYNYGNINENVGSYSSVRNNLGTFYNGTEENHADATINQNLSNDKNEQTAAGGVANYSDSHMKPAKFFNYGQINENESKRSSGGVINKAGEFTNYGTINNNIAARHCGGVDNTSTAGNRREYEGTFFKNYGEINGNIANGTQNGGTGSGGGVYNEGKAPFYNYGSICNNKAATSGGGIFISNDTCRLIVGGDSVITGNETGSFDADNQISDAITSNICLNNANRSKITFDTTGLTNNAKMGVHIGQDRNTMGIVTSGYSDGYSGIDAERYFFADNTSQMIMLNSNEIIIHTHDWTYEADGNVMQAYCTIDSYGSQCFYYGTEASHDNALTLTLTVSDADYSGNPYHGAGISKSEQAAWAAVGLTVPEIQYVKEGETASSPDAPVDAGLYKATITVEDKTAEAAFTIFPGQDDGDDDNDDYDSDNDSNDSGSSGGSSSGSSSGSGTASVPKTGVQDKGDSKEFVKADGTTAKSEWVKQGDDWYYAGTDGKLKTGWFEDSDGEWYYLNKETSVMETDWLQDTDGKWYYLDTESGAMKTGWLKDEDGDWYYLNQTSGVMETHWYQDEQDGKWYYLDGTSGKMKLGWFKDVNGKWYYFNEKASQQSWFMVGSDWVYNGIGERPLGSMYRGEMTPDGYYVDETGAWVQ